jgi:hypothetical protein
MGIGTGTGTEVETGMGTGVGIWTKVGKTMKDGEGLGERVPERA